MISAIDAKNKCIQMWKYIEDHITDPVWRENVELEYYGTWMEYDMDDNMKRYAILVLFPDDPEPNSNCYLCQYHRIQEADGEWSGCRNCSLSRNESGYNEPPCLYRRRPFASYILNVEQERWARAASAAHRLVTAVEQWEPKEE